MSSALRSLSQISVRSKFLIAVAADICGNTVAESSAFMLDASWPAEVGSIAAAADIVGTVHTYVAGALYRDLGRQIMLVDSVGAHVALYREAMPQNNVATEGVVLDSSVWLRVWAANGVGAHVARLG